MKNDFRPPKLKLTNLRKTHEAWTISARPRRHFYQDGGSGIAYGARSRILDEVDIYLETDTLEGLQAAMIFIDDQVCEAAMRTGGVPIAQPT